jgi:uncharacterized protein YndB with AHSA1/START domain
MQPDDVTDDSAADTTDDHRNDHLDDGRTAARFEQVVDLDATTESAWAALSDPGELARWLGASVELDVRPGGRGRVVDDDGTVREVLVTAVDDRQAIAWHWWSDGGELSSVELRIDECDGHARLHILEMLVPAPHTDERSSVARCSRRWTAATSRLWRHVGVAAFA